MAFSSLSAPSIRLGFPLISAAVVRGPTTNQASSCHLASIGGSLADLCYFLPQLCDALFDGLLHEERLAEQTKR